MRDDMTRGSYGPERGSSSGASKPADIILDHVRARPGSDPDHHREWWFRPCPGASGVRPRSPPRMVVSTMSGRVRGPTPITTENGGFDHARSVEQARRRKRRRLRDRVGCRLLLLELAHRFLVDRGEHRRAVA